MATVTFCPHCRGTDIYHRQVDASGSYGPDLLPDIGGWLDNGHFDLYVCGSCGHAQFFVESDRLEQVRKKWEKVETRLTRHE
jgi:hypothetical protein